MSQGNYYPIMENHNAFEPLQLYKAIFCAVVQRLAVWLGLGLTDSQIFGGLHEAKTC